MGGRAGRTCRGRGDMNDERERAGSDPMRGGVAAGVARVRQLCEQATGRNFGRTVLSVRAVPGGRGVEVHLSSWPRADEARRQLEPAGYLVTEMDPVPAHGVGLVVVDALQVRLSETELLEVEIAAGSTLAGPTPRQLVPRLVAEARASRAQLTQLGHAEPEAAASLGRSAVSA